MNEYLILSSHDTTLSVEVTAHAANAVIKSLAYKGSCMYFPHPDAPKSKVCILIDENDETPSATEWFLRTLAGNLDVDVYAADGVTLFFEGSTDNDVSALCDPDADTEALPLRLTFTLDGIDPQGAENDIEDYFIKNSYEINPEPDGWSVYIATNSYLDIYYLDGDSHLTAEIDCTFSGAGVYAEAAQLAFELSELLGANLNFIEDPSVTFTQDKDFEKLRRAFYTPLAAHFAAAVNDDRACRYAGIGWGSDTFEPEYIKGSVLTPFGRYNIGKLLNEVKRFGFSYVCDTYLLTRNTPGENAGYYVRETMNLAWNNPFGCKSMGLTPAEKMYVTQCVYDLELALSMDPYTLFPHKLYSDLCAAVNFEPKDTSTALKFRTHYDVGYFRSDVYYGFGHYLRGFRLPGDFTREEGAHGEEAVFYMTNKDRLRIEAQINYGYSGIPEESPLGSNWATGGIIEEFSIGGTSLCRFTAGEPADGYFRAEAEIYIRDELCRFAAVSGHKEDIETFRGILMNCRSAEDWYDSSNDFEASDPHAPGATFCVNNAVPPCRAFSEPFPYTNHLNAPFDPTEPLGEFSVQNITPGDLRSQDFLNALFATMMEGAAEMDGSDSTDQDIPSDEQTDESEE